MFITTHWPPVIQEHCAAAYSRSNYFPEHKKKYIFSAKCQICLEKF